MKDKNHNMIKPHLMKYEYSKMRDIEVFIQRVVNMNINKKITRRLTKLWWYI